MLAVFAKAIGKPPEELMLPGMACNNSKTPEEIVNKFQSLWPDSTVYNLSYGNFMALSHEYESPIHHRSIVVLDDIFCIFVGNLANIADLRHHYGLPRQATEAMIVVEAYKALRDRAPYPPDQVVKHLDGKFAFVIFDARTNILFLARDREGSVEFQWGMARDGSLVCSDHPKIIEEGCGKACARFPPGCFFINGSGLTSFDHPLHKVRAILNEDDSGNVLSVYFQVDLYTKIPSIPRSGSADNWADAAVAKGE
ncbi:stem-specific protein TSJT1-like [Gastrolobium bilobum]|uniref:stem-specific protein TSJT1-like n=1 Tax=Gastrolobium bilobum TaxID=150636 RepID=UPI002AAF17FD|nr:stem-specific protein TSJT1-like [Gastrolobium bilobum]